MEPSSTQQFPVQFRFWLVALFGTIFSLVVWKIMSFEFRYALVLCVGLVIFSLAMTAVFFIDDFLICALVCNIPFSIYGKWIAAQPIAVPAKGISLGLAEMLLAIAYFSWFIKIFVIKEESLPKCTKIDFFIGLLLITQMISLLGAPDKMLAFFDIVYNIKHALMYFFLANKIKKRHLKWIINFILLSIFLQGSIAIYERISGNVGIGTTKGNITSSEFATQGIVPGVEDELRGAGTTIDSHSLGLYLAMILPIPFVFLLMQFSTLSRKFLLLLVFLVGVSGLVITFSRSGWLSFALTSILSTWIIFFSWKQDKAFIVIISLIFVMIPFYPKFYSIFDKKIMHAPSELVDVRFEMAQTAVNIWETNPLFGYGPGNYLEAINDPEIVNTGHYGEMADRPVHNSFLWTAAELGIFGLASFGGIILMGICNCFKLLNCKDLLIRGISLALIAGFFAYLIDGITNMMFREAVPYAQLWLYIALSRVLKEQIIPQTQPSPTIFSTPRT